MISHAVMWKLKDVAQGDEVVRRLKNLEGRIPGLIRMEAGTDINRSDAAWDVVLFSVHESKEALESYQVHPEHVEVKNFIGSVAMERAVVDFSS